MPTKLQLCQQLHQELKLAGTLTTTIGTIGQLDRLCNAVVKADQFIQGIYTDWEFLWREWEQVLIVSTGDYTPPSGIGSFDESSFWIDAGTEDAYPLGFMPYKTWRDDLRHAYTEDDEPSHVVLKPNGTVVFVPSPDSVSAGSTVTADYWLAPVLLSSDAQVSLIPEQFHDAIIAMGKYYYGEYTFNLGLQNSAKEQFAPILKQLESHSGPGKSDDNKSDPSIPMVTVVQ